MRRPQVPQMARPCKQRGSFAWRSGAPVAAVGGGELGEVVLVGLVLGPGDEAGVGVGDEHGPFLAGPQVAGGLAAWAVGCGVAAVDERAGVAGVVQHLQDTAVCQPPPDEVVFTLARADASREAQLLLVERFDGGVRGAGGGKGGEQVPHSLLHAGVGIKDDPAGAVVDQPDR